MAALAVRAAEREPALVREGKLGVGRLVEWAGQWVEERRRNRKSADSHYEESYVEELEKKRAAQERQKRSEAQAAAAATSLEKVHAVRLTKDAIATLMRVHHAEVEVLAPLDLEESTKESPDP